MTIEHNMDHLTSIRYIDLVKRYPDYSEKIIRLFRENSSFRSLCGDYRACVNAIKYWSDSGLDNALARRVEYRDLLLELEEEVLIYLESPG